MKNIFIQSSLLTIFSSLALIIYPVDAQIATGEIDSDNPKIQISKDSLKVNLSYPEDTNLASPKVTVFENNNQVIEVDGVESSFAYAMIQIAEMDNTNDTPEIIFESFSGGAHCCTMALILTKQNNKWESLKLGLFDGGTNGLSDIDNNGLFEYVTVDNQFLYRFDSYVSSLAPPQIWRIESKKIINGTQEPQYKYWLKNRLNEFWQENVSEDNKKSNGFWAGYVGWKALIGEEINAWEIMLKNYDQSQTYCNKYDQEYNCIGKQEKFPSALLSFLTEINYLNQDSVKNINNLLINKNQDKIIISQPHR